MATSCAVLAPGRVNLIGEHTDYSGGFVLPAAIGFGVTVHGRAVADRIQVTSAQLEGVVDLAVDGSPQAELPAWGRYVAAVAGLLAEAGRPAIGLNATVSSTVPIGAGLSSSAALDIAFSLALCRVADFTVAPLDLARLAQQAELRAVGVPCGLMDPAASLLGRAGHALLLDCGTEQWRHVKLPPGIAIVVLDSGIRHALEHSGYAERRADVERALPALGGRRPSEVSVAEAVAAATRAGVDALGVRRLRHVVSENGRVLELVAALEAPALDTVRIGAIMRESHESQRDDFEVSTPEVDALVGLAYDHGALGARLTGGGFGGSAVALVEGGRVAAFIDAVEEGYATLTGRTGVAYLCATADGAGDLVGDSD